MLFKTCRQTTTPGQREIGTIFLGLFIFTAAAVIFLLDNLHRKYTYVTITQNNYFLPLPFNEERLVSVNFTDPQGRVTSLLKPEVSEVVPKVVHYIWFGKNEMFDFKYYLGVKSAFLNIKPTKVTFHYDYKPIGDWWHKLEILFRERKWTFEMVQREAPSTIYEHEITRPRHKVDISAIKILQEHGGIYLDFDVIVLKSLDPLRKYNFTMGLEYWGRPGRLNNGVILARKGARFLDIWHNSYRDFIKSEWDLHSAQVPYELQFRFPELIHVERDSINQPSGKQLELIYEKKFDWRSHYAVHLWEELHDLEHSPESITRKKTTFDEIAYLIYYEQRP